jgi:hypothetical protein
LDGGSRPNDGSDLSTQLTEIETAAYHSASKLHYMLLSGPVDLKEFQVLDMRRVLWCGWDVSLHALGVSHAVQLRRAHDQLTELLSCAPARPINGGAVLSTAACGAWEIRTGVFELEYGCRLIPLPLTEGMARTCPPGAHEFEVHYPIQAGNETPLTRIGWRTEPGRLLVRTLHTYPEECRAVVSESYFALHRDPPA